MIKNPVTYYQFKNVIKDRPDYLLQAVVDEPNKYWYGFAEKHEFKRHFRHLVYLVSDITKDIANVIHVCSKIALLVLIAPFHTPYMIWRKATAQDMCKSELNRRQTVKE